jgi:hypothetical protein
MVVQKFGRKVDKKNASARGAIPEGIYDVLQKHTVIILPLARFLTRFSTVSEQPTEALQRTARFVVATLW